MRTLRLLNRSIVFSFDTLKSSIKNFFYLQIAIICFLSFVAFFVKSLLALFSALVGGLIIILPEAALAIYLHIRWNFWRKTHHPWSYQTQTQLTVLKLTWMHGIKVLCSVILMLTCIYSRKLHWPFFLASYFLSLQAYLFALIL